MKTLEELTFEVEEKHGSLMLRLRRYVKDRRPSSGRAVLMLHGGNSSSDTYLLPNGGLAEFLTDKGWDVWLLDYRSSPFVQEKLGRLPLGGSVADERKFFTLDRIVAVDIPEALRLVRAEIDGAELSVMGHCIGGGAVALAIARGKLQSVENIVLSGLGLFYEVPWNGWMKAEDYLIERALSSDPTCRAIDPKDDRSWPGVMRQAYEHWPKAWLPQGEASGEKMLSRLAFMFGQPYFIEKLHPSLRGAELLECFGPMHMGLYWHIGQMVRRGYAGEFGAPDVIDRTRFSRTEAKSLRDVGPRTPELASGPRFKDKRVTLVAGAENRLWHRDSMDLMYEWLRDTASGGSGAVFKQVYPGYGLQELVWGEHARAEVFPNIEKGLRGVAP